MTRTMPADAEALIQSKKKIEELEQKARDLAGFVETTRRQILAQSDKKTEALEQKARDLADFVETLRRQTRLQSENEIEALGQKAQELAHFVESVRKETHLQFETEIAAMGQKARDLAVSVEAVRAITLQQSDSEIALLGQSQEMTRAMNEALMLGSVRQHELTDAAEDLNARLREQITARERISTELLQKAGELAEKARLLDLTHDAVIVRDMEGRIRYWNRGAEELYGWSHEEALGKVSHLLLQTEFSTPLEQLTEELYRTGRWIGELVRTTRDGRRLIALARKTLDRDRAGNPVAVLENLTDITARKRTEEALRESEARFRAAVGLVSSLIWTNNAEGMMEGEQPGWGNFTGQTEAEYRGYGWTQAVHEEDMQPTIDAWEKAVAEKRMFEFQHRVRRHDGEWRLCSIVAVPLLRSDGTIREWLGVHTDITERHLLEETLVARARELARADRSKDEFLAMLAHELRNPLAPLRSATEILRTPGATAEATELAVGILSRQIENMSEMIDDLLDVSRITEGKIELRPQVVALADVLNAAASLARPGLEARGQELKITLPAEPVFLHADATRLDQVFGNLLTNASKYSGSGCHIAISAERAAASPEVIVRVRDDGMGIAPDFLPRIFDLFVQATRSLDRASGGLGIGLTLVQRLVKLHGGSIEAHSAGLGHGSEFIVRLPILTTAIAPASPPTVPARDTPRRILIVDDNEDSARSMATLQTLRGHATRTAFTGPEALAAAAEFSPDVVLLDIGLPGMDGYEVARQLRAMPALAGAFLVAMSGYGSDEDRARARLAGFDEYLVKPADHNLLRTWLRGRR